MRAGWRGTPQQRQSSSPLCVAHGSSVEVGGGGQREFVFEELRRNCEPKLSRQPKSEGVVTLGCCSRGSR